MIRKISKYHNNKKHSANLSKNTRCSPKILHKVNGYNIFIKKDDTLVELFLNNCISWCCRHLGYRTDLESTPSVYWSYDTLNTETVDFGKANETNYTFLGYYVSVVNEIHLKINGHRTWVQLANTLIHEWIHYLQSSMWANRYDKHYTYDTNPYELEAYHYAAIFCNKCAEYSLHKINKHSKYRKYIH